jgi:hypothetical protein
MKKLILFVALFVPVLLSGYNWNPFGPPGIVANSICFSKHTVICTSTGIYVDDGPGYTWNSYKYANLSAFEAIPFDTDNMLLIMGNGTFPDGIYMFNLTSHSFNLIENLLSPTFIRYCETNKTYYAGSMNNGLLSSTDGINWIEVPNFKYTGCTALDFYGNHFVASYISLAHGFYYSSDTGRTWVRSSVSPGIKSMAFNSTGKLYGINSSGLNSSIDFGQNWQICYNSSGMNTVGFDVLQNILVGWKWPQGPDEGIAKFNVSASSMFFLNDGLPNKKINKIQFNPVMSSITIFCCTDSGVYSSNNYYYAGIQKPEQSVNKLNASVYPNPSSGTITIEYLLPLNTEKPELMFCLYDNYGNRIKEFPVKSKSGAQNSFSFDVSELVDGFYYFRLKSGNSEIIKKLIVQK